MTKGQPGWQPAFSSTVCSGSQNSIATFTIWSAEERGWMSATLAAETAKFRSCSQKLTSILTGVDFPHLLKEHDKTEMTHGKKNTPSAHSPSLNKYQHRDIGQTMSTIFSYPPQYLMKTQAVALGQISQTFKDRGSRNKWMTSCGGKYTPAVSMSIS